MSGRGGSCAAAARHTACSNVTAAAASAADTRARLYRPPCRLVAELCWRQQHDGVFWRACAARLRMWQARGVGPDRACSARCRCRCSPEAQNCCEGVTSGKAGAAWGTQRGVRLVIGTSIRVLSAVTAFAAPLLDQRSRRPWQASGLSLEAERCVRLSMNQCLEWLALRHMTLRQCFPFSILCFAGRCADFRSCRTQVRTFSPALSQP